MSDYAIAVRPRRRRKSNGHNGTALFSGPRRPLPLVSELRLSKVEQEQKLYCRHRSHCLTVADSHGWPAFSCRSCDGYERLSEAEIADETDSILRMMSRLGRCPSACKACGVP